MAGLERLTWVNGSFAAHVLEAKLFSEGIDCELRGAIDGPYVLTVGDMARVDVFVHPEQLEDARLVLLIGEVDETLAAPSAWAGVGPRGWPRWLTVLVLVMAALAPVAAYVRLR